MGVAETFLRKHCSKYPTQIAAADLIKMDMVIILDGNSLREVVTLLFLGLQSEFI